MEITFKNQAALVTGAASGMGLATARAFAQAGANVAMADINTQSLAKACETLKEEGFQVLPVVCDVSNENQVQAMVAATVKLSVDWMQRSTMREFKVR